MSMNVRINGGKIKAVRVNDKEIRLSNPINVENYEEVEKHLEYVRENFVLADFAKLKNGEPEEERTDWDKQTLFEFLNEVKRKGQPRQMLFFKILAQNPEGATKDEIVEWMREQGEEATGQSLGGIQGSITKRAENKYSTDDGRKRERIWTKERNSADERTYVVQEPYRNLLVEYFEEEY